MCVFALSRRAVCHLPHLLLPTAPEVVQCRIGKALSPFTRIFTRPVGSFGIRSVPPFDRRLVKKDGESFACTGGRSVHCSSRYEQEDQKDGLHAFSCGTFFDPPIAAISLASLAAVSPATLSQTAACIRLHVIHLCVKHIDLLMSLPFTPKAPWRQHPHVEHMRSESTALQSIGQAELLCSGTRAADVTETVTESRSTKVAHRPELSCHRNETVVSSICASMVPTTECHSNSQPTSSLGAHDSPPRALSCLLLRHVLEAHRSCLSEAHKVASHHGLHFVQFVKRIQQTQASAVYHMVLGMKTLSRDLDDGAVELNRRRCGGLNSLSRSLRRFSNVWSCGADVVESYLREYFSDRVKLGMLMSRYLQVVDEAGENCIPALSKITSKPFKTDSVGQAVKRACDTGLKLCEANYRRSPSIKLYLSDAADEVPSPDCVYTILLELIKNALQACLSRDAEQHTKQQRVVESQTERRGDAATTAAVTDAVTDAVMNRQTLEKAISNGQRANDVQVEVTADDHWLIAKIIDGGEGIAEEEKEKVWRFGYSTATPSHSDYGVPPMCYLLPTATNKLSTCLYGQGSSPSAQDGTVRGLNSEEVGERLSSDSHVSSAPLLPVGVYGNWHSTGPQQSLSPSARRSLLELASSSPVGLLSPPLPFPVGKRPPGGSKRHLDSSTDLTTLHQQTLNFSRQDLHPLRLTGFGCGLSLSRLYTEFLGGCLEINSCAGDRSEGGSAQQEDDPLDKSKGGCCQQLSCVCAFPSLPHGSPAPRAVNRSAAPTTQDPGRQQNRPFDNLRTSHCEKAIQQTTRVTLRLPLRSLRHWRPLIHHPHNPPSPCLPNQPPLGRIDSYGEATRCAARGGGEMQCYVFSMHCNTTSPRGSSLPSRHSRKDACYSIGQSRLLRPTHASEAAEAIQTRNLKGGGRVFTDSSAVVDSLDDGGFSEEPGAFSLQ